MSTPQAAHREGVAEVEKWVSLQRAVATLVEEAAAERLEVPGASAQAALGMQHLRSQICSMLYHPKCASLPPEYPQGIAR